MAAAERPSRSRVITDDTHVRPEIRPKRRRLESDGHARRGPSITEGSPEITEEPPRIPD